MARYRPGRRSTRGHRFLLPASLGDKQRIIPFFMFTKCGLHLMHVLKMRITHNLHKTLIEAVYCFQRAVSDILLDPYVQV